MIRLISYADIRDQAVSLLAEYADECSIPALGPINPQWEMYERLEASGVLVAFGVYDGAWLVGFATVLVSVLPHYGVKAATVESLFVAKAHRAGGFGRELLTAIEVHAEHVAHCKVILYSAPADGQLEALLGKRYTRTNAVFCKVLG